MATDRTGEVVDRAADVRAWLARPAVSVFVGCALVAGLIKSALLLIDHVPRYFFGDSGSYLATFPGRFVPDSRSWLYGSSMNTLADLADSLQPILVVQTGCAVVVCATVGTVAVTVFDCGRRSALLLAGLLAVEPLSLWYERSILAEVPATAAWIVAVALALQVVRRPDPAAGVASALAATVAVALRSAFIAPAVVIAVIGAGLALGHLLRRDRRRAFAVAALPLSLGLLLVAYAGLNGRMTHSPPSLNARSGYFLVGVTAPVIEADDLAGLGFADPAGMLEESGAAQRETRNAQVFGPRGIMRQLERQLGSPDAADDAATTIADRAIRRDPIGFLGLLLRQAVDYADPRVADRTFETWAGLNAPIEPNVQAIMEERLEYTPPADAPMRDSFTRTWLSATTWWSAVSYVVTVLASLASLLFARRVVDDAAAAALRLVAALTLAYVASSVASSVEVNPRYLLPALPLMALQLAVLARGTASRRRPSRVAHGAERRWATSPTAKVRRQPSRVSTTR